MVHDTSYVPAAAKKKRANRSAKLKQCKLDAKREQWLSNGNKKSTGTSASPASQKILDERSVLNEHDQDRSVLHEICDTESPIHDLNRRPPRKESLSSNSTSSSTSSIGSCSRSVSDAEEETEEKGAGGLDDWEAVADALYTDVENDKNPPRSVTHAMRPPVDRKQEPDRNIPRAWKRDDAFRPQSLPKHYATRHQVHRRILPTPASSCPICYEDLDFTDSSFLPCPCGFHLCLFCHKRIVETDGRCPGCRKQYSTTASCEEMRVYVEVKMQSVTYRFSRS